MEKVEIKLGYNFDPELPQLLAAANRKYDRKITEVYGSIRMDAWLAARPDFRLPDISRAEFISQALHLRSLGIMMNYTFNTPDPGSKRELELKIPELVASIEMLKEAEVDWITVTHPLIKELATKIADDLDYRPQWELSTINHLNTITQLRYNRQVLGYTKVCIDLWRNRDFGWLKEATRVGDEIGITISLLANEFCSNAGEMVDESTGEVLSFTTHCSYRDSCYGAHSDTVTLEDSLMFDNYPMQHCLTSRKLDKGSWLKSRFVLPQWIDTYVEKAGVRHFKITGRTASTAYIMKMVEAYLSGYYGGNLIQLWKSLSSIWEEHDEEVIDDDQYIDCSKLDNFINMWANQPDFRCAEVDCGFTCKYCNHYFAQVEDQEQDIKVYAGA